MNRIGFALLIHPKSLSKFLVNLKIVEKVEQGTAILLRRLLTAVFVTARKTF